MSIDLSDADNLIENCLVAITPFYLPFYYLNMAFILYRLMLHHGIRCPTLTPDDKEVRVNARTMKSFFTTSSLSGRQLLILLSVNQLRFLAEKWNSELRLGTR